MFENPWTLFCSRCHGLQPLPLRFGEAVSHLKACFGASTCGPKAIARLLRAKQLSLIGILDGAVAYCKKCRTLLSGGAEYIRDHFNSESCLQYSCGAVHIAEHIKMGLSKSHLEYKSELDLSTHPETAQAIQEGRLIVGFVSPCPAAGCFAAYPLEEKQRLAAHMKFCHRKSKDDRASFRELAEKTGTVAALPLGSFKYVRLLSFAAPPGSPSLGAFEASTQLEPRAPGPSCGPASIVTVHLPALPAPAKAEGKRTRREQLEELDDGGLPDQRMRTCAPRYLYSMGWHVSKP